MGDVSFEIKNGKIVNTIEDEMRSEKIAKISDEMNEYFGDIPDGLLRKYHRALSEDVLPTEQKERLENFIQTYEQMLECATIVPQYDPEEKYKLEDGDVEGFIVHGVHSSRLCVSLIRKGYKPTSDYFNYGNLDRV